MTLSQGSDRKWEGERTLNMQGAALQIERSRFEHD